MALDFDLKHAVYGGAGAAVGAIMGYFLGFILYIVVLSSAAFGSSASFAYGTSPIATMANNAGLFPLMFAVAFAALGFFGGFYISSKASEPKPAA